MKKVFHILGDWWYELLCISIGFIAGITATPNTIFLNALLAISLVTLAAIFKRN